jgi:uncharacterized membrane protein YfcA
MENLAGFVASALIGISLGLIGGGGSIITVPVLVYLFHIEPTLATAYSLFIVGSTSLVGGVQSALNKNVDMRSALMLALPSTTGVYLTRHFFLPHIPDVTRIANGLTITRDTGLMLLFAGIMIMASLRMIRNRRLDDKASSNRRYPIIILLGFSIGVITGIVGAGGGFLIIPALVLLLGLPMKKALGTSLIVIAINSLIGFLGDWSLVTEMEFNFLVRVTMLAISGLFLGTYLTRFIDGQKLKSGFGWFALTVALIIIGKEMMILSSP